MVDGNEGLLRLMAVGNQATDQVDQAVNRETMARMLNLRDVLELVDDRLDDGAFSEKQAVFEWG
ncbi:hypothetical protein H6F51_25820 [Cyanobacteria bacterium FACHB-DQ100]|nr:hypothetical protein [Cyanobacteria bacterium FACHB-DQ100]